MQQLLRLLGTAGRRVNSPWRCSHITRPPQSAAGRSPAEHLDRLAALDDAKVLRQRHRVHVPASSKQARLRVVWRMRSNTLSPGSAPLPGPRATSVRQAHPSGLAASLLLARARCCSRCRGSKESRRGRGGPKRPTCRAVRGRAVMVGPHWSAEAPVQQRHPLLRPRSSRIGAVQLRRGVWEQAWQGVASKARRGEAR